MKRLMTLSLFFFYQTVISGQAVQQLRDNAELAVFNFYSSLNNLIDKNNSFEEKEMIKEYIITSLFATSQVKLHNDLGKIDKDAVSPNEYLNTLLNFYDKGEFRCQVDYTSNPKVRVNDDNLYLYVTLTRFYEGSADLRPANIIFMVGFEKQRQNSFSPEARIYRTFKVTSQEQQNQIASADVDLSQDIYLLASDYTPECKRALLYFKNGEYKRALPLFESEANKGNKLAQKYVFEIYFHTKFGIQNKQKSNLWLKKLADKEHVPSMLLLGARYMGIWNEYSIDYQLAFDYLSRAAKKGSAQAKYLLSIAYFTGKGAPIDYGKGLVLLRSAAQSGSASASYSLGMLYEEANNLEQAISSFRMAAEGGHEKAKIKLKHYDIK